jgi:5-methylcytosine-specific restriction endonuclease McrBC regulatory subunit McrC
VIEHNSKRIIWDTKWKNIESNEVAISDLHQIYVYKNLFQAEKVFLVYPFGDSDAGDSKKIEGRFMAPK